MLAEMVLSRRRQWDGHIEPLQSLHVMDNQLYKMDIRPIEDEVLLEDDFRAGFDMIYLINKNGEHISIHSIPGLAVRGQHIMYTNMHYCQKESNMA